MGFVDAHGEQVLRFMGEARNLSRIGELTDEVVEIAESGAWRSYRTALGEERWRECELDYFLISCDLRHEDVSRVLAYTRKGSELAGMMNRNANGRRRRSLETAAKAWHAPGPETLIERAQRLGWTRSKETEELRAPPLSPRVRGKQEHGVTLEEHARKERASRIPAKRRRELDALARETRKSLADDQEVRYLIDQLAKVARREPGRPKGDHEQWAKDVTELNGDTKALAERWGISRQATEKRLAQLNTRNKLQVA